MFSTDNYIGIPYRKNGRDRSGLDCYGLGILLYKDAFGIELEEVSFLEKENISPGMIHKEFSKKSLLWNRVSDLKKFDLLAYDTVHITDKKIVSHVAFYVGNERIMHVNESIGSVVIQKMHSYGHELIGIYRHAQNA